MQKLQINFHAQVFFIIIIIYSIEVLENRKKKNLTLSVVVQTIKREDFFVFKLTFTWYVV